MPRKGKKRYETIEGALYEAGMPTESLYRICFACGLFALLVALGLSIAAIVLASGGHWTRDKVTNDIVSRHDIADVVVRPGNDLIVHNRILHSGSDVMAEKTLFTPVIPLFPTGDDFIFGDQNVPYTRVQSGLAIGFRLGTNSFLTPPGVLLGEPDLKVLIEPLGVHVASIFVPFFGVFIPSDARIKVDVEDIPCHEALGNVMKLRPRTYYYIDQWHEMLGENTQEDRGTKRRGFIAQEVESVLPHSVKKSAVNIDGEMVDDFRDLRKEDIISDVVSAIHMLVYDAVLDSADSELQSSADSAWVQTIKTCMGSESGANCEHAKCICNAHSEMCPAEQAHPETGTCRKSHPLFRRCSTIAT